MADEEVKRAIQTAIQMEKEGHAFYTKAAAETSSDMGAKIFESIAKDELIHLATFQKLFEEKVSEGEWKELAQASDKYERLPVFPKDLKQVEGANPDTNELDALSMAMKSEQDAIEFYGKIMKQSGSEEVKKIIGTIIEQEKNHYLVLNEEFTHLSSQGYWFGLDVLGQ